MTISTSFMPDVLVTRDGAISVHRALKGIKTLIEHLEPVGERDTAVQIALDDLDIMIGAAANGRDLKAEGL